MDKLGKLFCWLGLHDWYVQHFGGSMSGHSWWEQRKCLRCGKCETRSGGF